MSFFCVSVSPSLFAAASVFAVPPAFAQSGDAKSSDKPAAAQPADPAKDAQRQVDEFAEAARLVTGPAGNPECVWLGRRVVGLLWRDDMDTAFRHLDLYDRFGCPGPHIQAAFRCVVRQGNNIDPKRRQSLNARVHACWLNPTASQAAAAPRRGSHRVTGGIRLRPGDAEFRRQRRAAAGTPQQGSALGGWARSDGVRHQFAIDVGSIVTWPLIEVCCLAAMAHPGDGLAPDF